jgi:ribosomal protein S18 acetylase RimI-like enzyme
MDPEIVFEAADQSRLALIRHLWEELNRLNSELHRKYFGWKLRENWHHKHQEFKKRFETLFVKFDLAKSGGTIVAYCISSVNASLEGEIISIYTRPDFRGRGIGKKLVTDHLAWMRAHHAKYIFVYVHPCNTGAIRFYWQFNFFSNSPLMEICQG